MYRAALIVVLSICAIISGFYSQAQKSDTTKLFNAFYLAKAIADRNFTSQANVDTLTLRKILGGAMWYANSDVQSAPNIDVLLSIARAYPLMRTRLRDMSGTLYGKVSLAGVPTSKIRQAFNDARDTSERRRRILRLLDSIDRVSSRIDNKRFEETRAAISVLKVEEQKREDSLVTLRTIILDSANRFRLPPDTNKLTRELNAIKENIEKQQRTYDVYESANEELAMLQKQLMSIRLTVNEKEKISGKSIQYDGQARGDESEKAISSYTSSVINYTSVGDAASAGAFRLPNQSQIIDAMAIYLVKRVKQESVLWFFETLQKDMKAYDLVKTCFPNCFELLQSNKLYEVPKMGSLWRYAISKDFAMMPRNIFESQWMANKLGSNKILKEGLSKAWRVAQLIQQKYEYKDIITTLYTEMSIDEITGPSATVSLNTMVSLLYCVNEEFYKQTGSNHFQRLKYNDLLRMTDDELEIMLSLIDMKYNFVIRTLLLRDVRILDIGRTGRLGVIRKWLGAVLLKVDRMDKLRDELKRESSSNSEEGTSKFDYTDYNTWRFLKELLQTLNFSSMPGAEATYFKTWDTKIVKIITAMSDVQEVFQLLEQKNFAGSVNRLFDIVQSLIPNDRIVLSMAEFKVKLKEQKISYFEDALENTLRGRYQEKYGYTILKNDSVEINKNSPLHFITLSKDRNAINIIQKLAGFLNDVAYAQSGKELSKVIEAYAMPSGSYKKKRGNWLSFDLNAFVGIYGGQERVKVKNIKGQDSVTSTGGVYGLTAPIGFAFTKTFGKKLSNKLSPEEISGSYSLNPEMVKLGTRNRWVQSKLTISAFLSIIDIGAVVSYRFTSNEETLPQAVKWDQVLSPGLHLNIGIPNTPLVFATGYQYTPKLRKLKGLLSDEQLNSQRIYAAILFDLPIFNLYTKSVSVRR